MMLFKKGLYIVLFSMAAAFFCTKTEASFKSKEREGEMKPIIFINGCSSSGKASIIKALEELCNEPILKTGLYLMGKAIPRSYCGFGSHARDGVYFEYDNQKEQDPLIKVGVGDFGSDIYKRLAPLIAGKMASFGYPVIVSEVLYDEETFLEYANALSDHKVYFIGIICDRKIRQEREILRGDRPRGLTLGQEPRYQVYEPYYDLIVDTTHLTPFEAAQKILDTIKSNSSPEGFKKAELHFKKNRV